MPPLTNSSTLSRILGKGARSVMSAKVNEHHPQSKSRLAKKPLKAHQRTPKSPSSPLNPREPSRMPSRRKQSDGRKHRPARHSTSDPSPLVDFFAKYYPDFEYDPTESASHEFYRLCDVSGWDRGDLEREDAYEDFKNALVRQFNEAYGTNEDDLGDWQSLCHIVRIEPVPDDLNTCREAVRGRHVNLVDLVDAHTTGEEVLVFDSERELSEYTRMHGKYFPKESAYAGGLLRYLLRHILHPAPDAPSRRRIKKRR